MLCEFAIGRQLSGISAEKSVPLETVYPSVNNDANTASAKIIYQCKYCFTVYDEAFGDAENNIAPGTSFNNLPESYHCPLCESGKNDFVTINESSLELQDS